MNATEQYAVENHEIENSTDFASELEPCSYASVETIGHGHYAASGRLANGDQIDMAIMSVRMASQPEQYWVFLAVNGKCSRRQHALDGNTSRLADWLRNTWPGKPLGVPAPNAPSEILDRLYADVALLKKGQPK